MKKLPAVESSRFIQMYEDTWYRMDSPGVEECCDCGLVHHVEWKIHNGTIFWRARVNRRATNAARKRDGIKVVKRK
jgi:hypothetical protein